MLTTRAVKAPVPKQGYRFVAPVVRVEADGRQLPEAPAPTLDAPQHDEASGRRTAVSVGPERGARTQLTLQAGRVWWPWLGLGVVLILGVCDYASTAVGGSWNRDGDILLGNALGGLIRCLASGGPATPITVPEDPEQERHIFPSFLSDGRHFIYLRISRRTPEVSGIYAGELGRASPPHEERLIATRSRCGLGVRHDRLCARWGALRTAIRRATARDDR